MAHEKGYWVAESETDTHDYDKKLAKAIINNFLPICGTAIDIGCGNGGYTMMLNEAGIKCAGYDGSPLTEKITGGACKIQDFAVPVNLGVHDLVLCLEVGEHVPRQYEQIFIDNITRHAKDYIVLSWAVEGQPGIGHVNCRNNDYIINELNKRDFSFVKALSGKLRKNSVFPWFRDTVMVFERKNVKSSLDIFKNIHESMVSVVLTSCGRPELLKRTLSSFEKFNTFPIHKLIIIEDSGNKKQQDKISNFIKPEYQVVYHKKNKGLIKSIDEGYSLVKTPFIFHMEDDWEFYRSGFIENSLNILLNKEKIMQVWIRDIKDTNGHPLEEPVYMSDNTLYKLTKLHVNDWHGFSFNPGLRRYSDYKIIGPYDSIAPDKKAGYAEMIIGQKYFKAGYRSAILLDGYIKHIGTGHKTYSLV